MPRVGAPLGPAGTKRPERPRRSVRDLVGGAVEAGTSSPARNSRHRVIVGRLRLERPRISRRRHAIGGEANASDGLDASGVDRAATSPQVSGATPREIGMQARSSVSSRPARSRRGDPARIVEHTRGEGVLGVARADRLARSARRHSGSMPQVAPRLGEGGTSPLSVASWRDTARLDARRRRLRRGCGGRPGSAHPPARTDSRRSPARTRRPCRPRAAPARRSLRRASRPVLRCVCDGPACEIPPGL